MAHPSRRRSDNAPGSFFVEDTCIDCDACRWLAPDTFARVGEQSAVKAQPDTPERKKSALQALAACPTASIGMDASESGLGPVRAEFPIPIDDSGLVRYCGYHSEKSFGAAAYYLPTERLLIDSPREAAPLMRRFLETGGVSRMLFTHGDDVADHAAYRARFGCARWIHQGDAQALPESEGVWSGSEPRSLGPDLLLIPVPGHTRGSCCFLYREEFLFTGDHLAFSERRGHLYAFRDACWYSWKEQIVSMEKLLDYRFKWVLPGHGRRHFCSAEDMKKQLERCLDWMRRQ